MRPGAEDARFRGVNHTCSSRTRAPQRAPVGATQRDAYFDAIVFERGRTRLRGRRDRLLGVRVSSARVDRLRREASTLYAGGQTRSRPHPLKERARALTIDERGARGSLALFACCCATPRPAPQTLAGSPRRDVTSAVRDAKGRSICASRPSKGFSRSRGQTRSLAPHRGVGHRASRRLRSSWPGLGSRRRRRLGVVRWIHRSAIRGAYRWA